MRSTSHIMSCVTSSTCSKFMLMLRFNETLINDDLLLLLHHLPFSLISIACEVHVVLITLHDL